MALGVGEGARLHQQRLEPDEHLPRHDLEPALGLVRRVERIHGIAQRLDASESLGPDQPRRVEAQGSQVVLCRLDRLQEGHHQLLDRRDDLAFPPPSPSSSSSPRAYCASASRRLLSMPL